MFYTAPLPASSVFTFFMQKEIAPEKNEYEKSSVAAPTKERKIQKGKHIQMEKCPDSDNIHRKGEMPSLLCS